MRILGILPVWILWLALFRFLSKRSVQCRLGCNANDHGDRLFIYSGVFRENDLRLNIFIDYCLSSIL